jgi:hypothetical protein
MMMSLYSNQKDRILTEDYRVFIELHIYIYIFNTKLADVSLASSLLATARQNASVNSSHLVLIQFYLMLQPNVPGP